MSFTRPGRSAVSVSLGALALEPPPGGSSACFYLSPPEPDSGLSWGKIGFPGLPCPGETFAPSWRNSAPAWPKFTGTRSMTWFLSFLWPGQSPSRPHERDRAHVQGAPRYLVAGPAAGDTRYRWTTRPGILSKDLRPRL